MTTITVNDNGTANGTTVFGTVQAAVNFAAANSAVSEIVISASSYREQVVVDGATVEQALLIRGVDGAQIAAPNGLVKNVAGGNAAAVVAVINGANVTIDNVDVNGRNAGGQVSGSNFYGVYFSESAGAYKNGAVVGVYDAVNNGSASTGRAIRVESTSTHTVDITNNTISGFDKTALDVRGAGLTVNVTGNTVTGSGYIGFVAQNGITVVGGVHGVINGNTISGIGFSRGDAATGGILLFDAANLSQINANTITMAGPHDGTKENNGISIAGNAGPVQIAGNTISNADAGIAYINGDASGTFQQSGSVSEVDQLYINNAVNLSFTALPGQFSSNAYNLTGTTGADELVGSNGNDVINGGGGSFGSTLTYDLLDGGSGTDTLSFAGNSAGVTASLAVTTVQATGGAGNVQALNFENIDGSAFADTLSGNDNGNAIRGDAGNDSISGNGGNDYLLGGGGDDTVRGNLGNDIIIGGRGNDSLVGGAGSDILDGGAENGLDTTGNDFISGGSDVDTVGYLTANGGVTVSLAQLLAQNTGAAGTDTIEKVENLIGSHYDDVLSGDGFDNIIGGFEGNDNILGGAGNDTLFGGLGNDTVRGGQGDDRIVGGEGDDLLRGGTGADTFYFSNNVEDGFGTQSDTIEEFVAADDSIDLGGQSVTSHFAAGNSTLLILDSGDSILLSGFSNANYGSINFVNDESGTASQEPTTYLENDAFYNVLSL